MFAPPHRSIDNSQSLPASSQTRVSSLSPRSLSSQNHFRENGSLINKKVVPNSSVVLSLNTLSFASSFGTSSVPKMKSKVFIKKQEKIGNNNNGNSTSGISGGMPVFKLRSAEKQKSQLHASIPVTENNNSVLVGIDRNNEGGENFDNEVRNYLRSDVDCGKRSNSSLLSLLNFFETGSNAHITSSSPHREFESIKERSSPPDISFITKHLPSKHSSRLCSPVNSKNSLYPIINPVTYSQTSNNVSPLNLSGISLQTPFNNSPSSSPHTSPRLAAAGPSSTSVGLVQKLPPIYK
jgi:hypothetical protein